MNQLFILQLAVSIFVGGFFVSIQTLLAERAPQNIAGILLSVPSTLAIGLIFIAITISPTEVAAVATVIPASFGITLAFNTVYVYLANSLRFKQTATIFVSATGAILVWLFLATPLAYFEIDNMIFSLCVYAFLVVVSHYFLAIKPNIETNPINIRYTTAQKIMRAVFGGLIIGLIVFLAKFFGPFWGAIFSAFPAVYLSMLLIVHHQHGKSFLFHITKALPVASPIFVIYTFVIQYSYPSIGVVLGTLAAFAISALYPIVLSYVLNKKLFSF